jgi:hypothetical protein
VFSWNFRDLWSGVGGYLRDDLEQAEASAQARWFAQHGANGEHTGITATTADVDRFRISDPLIYNLPAASNTSGTSPGASLVLPRKTSAVIFHAELGGGPYTHLIHSIVMPDVQPGDLLVLIKRPLGNCSLAVANSVFNDASGGGVGPYFPLGNRIFIKQSLGAVFSNNYSGSTYVTTWYEEITGIFMRVNDYDYDSTSASLRYPAWVQIG